MLKWIEKISIFNRALRQMKEVIDFSDQWDEAKKCMVKLLEYERTGLTPRQITEMDILYTEKCREVARMTEKHEKANEEKWILCTERMPSVSVEIEDECCPEFNVTIKGAALATTLKFDSEGTWFDDNGNIYPVIAWQPLPDAYRPGQKAVGEDYKQQIMRRFLRQE